MKEVGGERTSGVINARSEKESPLRIISIITSKLGHSTGFTSLKKTTVSLSLQKQSPPPPCGLYLLCTRYSMRQILSLSMDIAQRKKAYKTKEGEEIVKFCNHIMIPAKPNLRSQIIHTLLHIFDEEFFSTYNAFLP